MHIKDLVTPNCPLWMNAIVSVNPVINCNYTQCALPQAQSFPRVTCCSYENSLTASWQTWMWMLIISDSCEQKFCWKNPSIWWNFDLVSSSEWKTNRRSFITWSLLEAVCGRRLWIKIVLETLNSHAGQKLWKPRDNYRVMFQTGKGWKSVFEFQWNKV